MIIVAVIFKDNISGLNIKYRWSAAFKYLIS